MLEKKTGMRKIHVMRIITLIEAEFNLALKFYYSKNIMPNAEETDLSPDQWGGRKDRSAPACAMRKVITWEYARYTKTVLGSFFGDLQSNFNRMMRELSSYVSRKKGLPKLAAKCRAMTIAGMVRSVWTAWGRSKGSYQEEPGEHPCGGECQGKGDTMALWILFSDILLSIHKEKCHRIKMVDAMGTIESRQTTDTYVDDSDNWATAPESQTAEEGVRTLQHHAQMWAVLVAVTGQLLAFHKCSWQLIVWLAVNGYYIMASRTNFDNENVILTDHNGMESTIEYKSHREHNKGLGFLMCPDENQDPEFKH
jgi:hypothetical protein